MASRSVSSAEMSENARSWVCRCKRREIRYAASAPTARAPPAYASSPGIAARSRARTLSYAIPTDTAPITSPDGPNNGTLPRAERPRVPLSISITSRPRSASPGSVETTAPIRWVSGCDQRTPRWFMTTTYSAPVARLTRSAADWTGPPSDGSVLLRCSTMSGSAAVDWAMARARRIAWSSSWSLSGARKRPVTRIVTPVMMASCISRTWEKTR